MKYYAIIACLLLTFAAFIILPASTSAEVSYDITYDDPEGDVELYGTTTRAGYNIPDIDITQISSTLDTGIGGIKENIILTLTVYGAIAATNDTGYVMQIMADDDQYMIGYSSGVAVDLATQRPVLATGGGTDTLTLTIPLKDITVPTSVYNISAFVARTLPDGERTYMDFCPDDTAITSQANRPLEITGPTDGATVWGVEKVTGITQNTPDNKTIKYVELQVDSQSQGGWKKAATFDGWMDWSYDWDTTESSDGTHILYARAYNGSAYSLVQRTYWVDQTQAITQRSMGLPELRIGDRYVYEGSGKVTVSGIVATLTESENLTLWGLDIIESKGHDYECFIYRMEAWVQVKALGYTIDAYTEGYLFMDHNTLSTVRSDIWVNSTIPMEGEQNVHTVSDYDPPLDTNQFPLTVSDRWISSSSVTTTTTQSGETDTQQTETTSLYECLRVQDVGVPAGSFESFVTRSNSSSSGIGSPSVGGVDLSSLTEGYALSYFSGAIGTDVLQENYDSSGNLLTKMELVEFSRGTGVNVIILNITADPDLEVGKQSEITVTLMNRGIVPANATSVYINDSGVELEQRSVDIGPKETYVIKIAWTPSESGAHSISASTPYDTKHSDVVVGEKPSDNKTDYRMFLWIAVGAIIVIIIVVIFILMKRKRPTEAMVVD